MDPHAFLPVTAREVPTRREYDASNGIATRQEIMNSGLSPMTMSSSCCSANSAAECGGQSGYNWGEPSHRRTRGASLFGGFGGCGDNGNDTEGYAAAFAGCGNGYGGASGGGFAQPQKESGWPASSGISSPTGAQIGLAPALTPPILALFL